MESSKDIILKAQQFLDESECILIGAGAGLTAAAGVDYTDQVAFSEYFPAWKRRGFDMQYQLMGYRNWTQAEQWGYLTVHLNYVYFQQGKNELYRKLRKLIGPKEYFVMTSNVDEFFHKNDFDASNIYTPQGSYGNIQCTTPCSQQVWETKPFFDVMFDNLDAEEQVLTDDVAIPKCPNCGENMFLNVRVDRSFIEKPYVKGREALTRWLNTNKNKKMALLEFGAGYNTPGVIRMPMESIKAAVPDSSFIRVNMKYPEIPMRLRENSLSVEGNIENFINGL